MTRSKVSVSVTRPGSAIGRASIGPRDHGVAADPETMSSPRTGVAAQCVGVLEVVYS